MAGTVLGILWHYDSKYFHHLQEVGIIYYYFKDKKKRGEKKHSKVNLVEILRLESIYIQSSSQLVDYFSQ